MLKTAFRIASATVLVTVSLAFGSPAGAAADPYPGTPQQIRDTGPCGPTGGYRASEWLQTTTDPTIQPEVDLAAVREAWYWRHDGNTLWRGDTRTPQTIFASGFEPRGMNLIPLSQWIIGGAQQPDAAHVSTTCERWVAQEFATGSGDGWVYAIQAPGGIDINATARQTGLVSTFLWNKEIDFPGGIEARFIEGACKYHFVGRDPQTNDRIYRNLGCVTNPDFRPVPSKHKEREKEKETAGSRH
ncbi:MULTISPECIES: scabin-related ADP-ribosyltransferase [unclassified Streptomyces]|uniref:scabin-related ADP-ribosyltransferase n=1 Tax=unclassified Streptomyces TaxID=2593676 RepID=UPI00386FF0D9